MAECYREDGIYLAVEPPSRVVYTSLFTPISADEGEPFEIQVTVTFTEQEGGTLLRVTERGYPSTDVRDAFLRDGTSTGLIYFERSLPLRPPAAAPDT
jgi:uncharacterized protein YndB with AHSA1/START domain